MPALQEFYVSVLYNLAEHQLTVHVELQGGSIPVFGFYRLQEVNIVKVYCFFMSFVR